MRKEWLIKQLTLAVSNADYTLARYLNEQLLEVQQNESSNKVTVVTV